MKYCLPLLLLLLFDGPYPPLEAAPRNFYAGAFAHPAQQTTNYQPPTLTPLFSASDMANSATLMVNVNAAVTSRDKVILQHDADLYDPTVGIAVRLRTAETTIADLQKQVASLLPKALVVVHIPAYNFTSFANAPPGQPITCPATNPTQTCYAAVGETYFYNRMDIPPGTYTVSVTGVSNSGGAVSVTGPSGDSSGTLVFPSTGSFSSFSTITGGKITIPAGQTPVTITVKVLAAPVNLTDIGLSN